MAKTFKHLAHPTAATPRPISERDFFDLTDEETAPAPPSPNASLQPQGVGKKVSKPSPAHNTDNTGKQVAVTENEKPSLEESASQIAVPHSGRDVRQTFVLSEQHLERLRDYVHARRAGGDYLYSQKQALQEALELLFATAEPAAPRPAQLREHEQQRRTRIQRGRTSGKNQ